MKGVAGNFNSTSKILFICTGVTVALSLACAPATPHALTLSHDLTWSCRAVGNLALLADYGSDRDFGRPPTSLAFLVESLRQ